MVTCPSCGRAYTGTTPITCSCGRLLAPAYAVLTGLGASGEGDLRSPHAQWDHEESQEDRDALAPLAILSGARPETLATEALRPYRTPPARRLVATSTAPQGVWPWIAGTSLIGNGLLFLMVVFLALALLKAPASGVGTGGQSTTGHTSVEATLTPTPPSGMQTWPTTASCVPTGQSLYVIGVDPHDPDYLCRAPTPPFTNGRVQVAATFLQGGNGAILGLAVRIQGQGPTLSDDEVWLRQDGQVAVVQRLDGQDHPLQDFQPAAPIRTGQGATNTVTMILQGANLTVLINGGEVVSVTDTANAHAGAVGLLVGHNGQEGLFSSFSLAPTS